MTNKAIRKQDKKTRRSLALKAEELTMPTPDKPYTAEELVDGKKKLELAMSAMLRSDYFFLEVVSNLRIKPEMACWVAAVIVNPMPTLFYNPRNILKLNIKQIIYVLKHEIFHIILEHFARRHQFHQQNRFNYAADCEDNCQLGEPPIDGLLYPGKGEGPCKKLQPGNVFEVYYNQLPKMDPPPGSGGGGVGQCKGKGKDNGDQDGDGGGDIKDIGKHFEVSHLQEYDPDDVGTVHIKDIIKEAVEHSRTMGQGVSGDLERLIDQYLKKNKLNWKRLLRNLLGAGAKFSKKTTWKRPSRRFGKNYFRV